MELVKVQFYNLHLQGNIEMATKQTKVLNQEKLQETFQILEGLQVVSIAFKTKPSTTCPVKVLGQQEEIKQRNISALPKAGPQETREDLLVDFVGCRVADLLVVVELVTRPGITKGIKPGHFLGNFCLVHTYVE